MDEHEAILAAAVPAYKRRVNELVLRRQRRTPEATLGGRRVWRNGINALQTCVDHLAAWELLSHVTPRPVMAHFSLLRGAIDGAVAARWLFDPRISPTERAGRGYRADVVDLAEMQKIEDLDPQLQVEGVGPAEHAATLRAEAAAAGVTIAPYPRYTTLAATYAAHRSSYAGSGAYLYALLSAAAHGRDYSRHLANHNARLRSGGEKPRPILIMDLWNATWTTRIVLEVAHKALTEAELYAAQHPADG